MATFSNIAGQEPSTVSFRAATVEITRGATVEDQEIICLGDPDTSNAIAAILAGTPGSTAWGLAVREVAPTTIVQVSSVGGAVVARSSAANFLASVYQSSAADLNVTVAGYSTTVQVSSLGGVVTASPVSSSGVSMSTDTTPASTKQGLIVRQVGFTIDSSGALQVNTGQGGSSQVSISQVSTAAPASNDTGVVVRQVGYSTTVNVSSLAGKVLVDQNSTVWPVQIPSSQSVQVKNSTIGDLLASVQQNSTAWVTQTRLFDSSQVAINASTAAPATGDNGLIVRQVGYSTVIAISSISGAVTVGPNSTAAPASNDTGVVVRQVGYSTTVNVSSLAGVVTAAPISSSGVSMSTDADPASTKQGLIVRQVGFSTIAAVSSVSGRVATMPFSTGWASSAGFHVEATSGALLVGAGSTVWQTQAHIIDSSGVIIGASTAMPVNGQTGLHVRQVTPTLLSTAFSTQGNGSTSNTVVSSAAGLRHKVYAYSITSTVQAINSLSFASGLSNVIWTMQMQAMSSGIAGANLAVSPPSWLFATDAGAPLVFKETGTTGTYHLAFSYFSEA